MPALSNRWFVIGSMVGIVLLLCLMLPAVQVAKGVGHTDLEIQFVISNEDGARMPGAEVKLVEIKEGLAPGDPITLTSDERGVVSYAFPNVTFTNAMDVFGREVDYTVDIPWWEVTVVTRGNTVIKSEPLPLLAKELNARAIRAGFREAKLEIPIQVRSAE